MKDQKKVLTVIVITVAALTVAGLAIMPALELAYAEDNTVKSITDLIPAQALKETSCDKGLDGDAIWCV